ncbi:hypothetical protein IFM47457_03932 [Aspergillus lentulus]|nr:hypothetical protein IFM47457_03932 [Aspergillus lentulus]
MSGKSGQPHTSKEFCTANVPRSKVTDFEFDPPTSRNPWDLLPKWPVTHRHRIAELDFLATYYDTVGQTDNIKAAKVWHATFPLDDQVGYETAYFHRGKKEPPPEIMMSGHCQNSVRPLARRPAAVTGSTPQPSSLVTPAAKTTNEGDVSDNANVPLDPNFIFEPPTSTEPWNLVPRWPITHGQRIAELKFLATFYGKRGQEENLQAAINWHSEFPQDALVGNESRYFQDGAVIDEFDIKSEGGPCWYEGPPDYDLMTGHDQRQHILDL